MLELRGIEAGYDSAKVLHRVSLAVPAGTAVAVIGANGAGKTTLLRVASRLLTPHRGTLVLDGVDVTRWPADRLARAGVCHVPEGGGIFRRLTVRENLRFQLRAHQSSQDVDRAITAFPVLGHRLSQMAGTLSGGEQQMLALARAYIRSPRVLLLDEVSLGLAPIIVDEIFAFLEAVAREGVSLLIVEQYVNRALQLADFVFVLERGRVAFAGETGEVDEESVYSNYLSAS